MTGKTVIHICCTEACAREEFLSMARRDDAKKQTDKGYIHEVLLKDGTLHVFATRKRAVNFAMSERGLAVDDVDQCEHLGGAE